MTDAEHSEIVELEKNGKLLVGVDRPTARKVFTNLTVWKIKEETGYAPYLEKSIVFSVFVLGPIALVGSVVAAFVGFGWWGLIPAAVFPFLYFAYYGMSSHGGAGPYPISILLVICIGLYSLDVFQPAFMRPAVLFVFALWCGRMVYVFATFFCRAMALRNAKLYDFLSEAIVIRHSE